MRYVIVDKRTTVYETMYGQYFESPTSDFAALCIYTPNAYN